MEIRSFGQTPLSIPSAIQRRFLQNRLLLYLYVKQTPKQNARDSSHSYHTGNRRVNLLVDFPISLYMSPSRAVQPWYVIIRKAPVTRPVAQRQNDRVASQRLKLRPPGTFIVALCRCYHCYCY